MKQGWCNHVYNIQWPKTCGSLRVPFEHFALPLTGPLNPETQVTFAQFAQKCKAGPLRTKTSLERRVLALFWTRTRTRKNMAQKPNETTQYGLLNFESVSTGLNIWSVLITIIVILCLICLCESCCGGPSQMLRCCFQQRNFLRNPMPATGCFNLEIGTLHAPPSWSYPGFANNYPNWRSYGAEPYPNLPLATTAPPLPTPQELRSLQMSDGRLTFI